MLFFTFVKRLIHDTILVKAVAFLLLFLLSSNVFCQQVAEVITDFGGFWKSGLGAINATLPNTSHNVLSFRYNAVNYSTGVDDGKLSANSITYTAGDFKAFPVATVGGTVTGGSSIYIALASRYDGVTNGYSVPPPSLRIKDVLIDGTKGLNLGTGATNIPAGALVNFPISTITTSSISDAKPDILVTQIAAPSSTGDTLYFVNSSGGTVGSRLAINWTTISPLGAYFLDLYTLPTGALCDTARINGTFDRETTRDIRLLAFKLSDFGINAGNAAAVSGFILKASGSSDPAFMAYNADAFTIPAPVITNHPVSQVVCPNASNNASFSVTATGGSLTYQWKRNNVDIPGATNATYTITNVVGANAASYSVVVTNPVGSVISNIAHLNVSVAFQPTPAIQTIATGSACTLSIAANNGTSFQWRRGNDNISGATASSFTINSVPSTDTFNYSVVIRNSAGGGCADITSNTIKVVGSKILYSKPGVNLSLASSWGVEMDGSGSSPVDFTRAEHTFVVKQNAATGGDLTIAGTLDVSNSVTTITAGSTLDVAKVIRSGTGSIAVSSTSNLTVRDTSNLFFHSGNNTIRNLTVHGGNVTLLNALSISAGSSAGTVALNGGLLHTGGNLTLKSNGNGTARLAVIPAGAGISGAVTIERFIPAARGWRYLSVPVKSTGAPTINQAWQEGVTTASPVSNPYPGFGGQITGGTTANGFDQSSTNGISIKVFNNATNSFVRLPASPGTNIPITSYPAYSIYLRGDRGINLMQGLSAAITSTTLRIKGEVNTGDQIIPVNSARYTFVGNPYASAIDFASVSRNNVSNTIYLWDPKMAGTYGLGGYVTVSWNNATGTYDKTTSVSPASQYIQSGQAFFVSSADGLNPGSLVFKESDKTASGNDLVYRTSEPDKRVRVDLFSADTASSPTLLDGILTTYDEQNSNEFDANDAIKMFGGNQSINIKSKDKWLAIERRKTITTDDTTFLNIYQMKAQQYYLEINAQNMESGNLTAFLKDNYSSITNNFPINLAGTTVIPFSITTDPASFAVNRFSIVYKALTVLPVTFKTLKAKRVKEEILVEWEVENAINISKYVVERSRDGRNFVSVTSVLAGPSANASYSFADKDVTSGVYYYRVQSIGLSNERNYSAMVKANMPSNVAKIEMTLFPNPVRENAVSLEIDELAAGNYSILVSNINGQLVQSALLKHPGDKLIHKIQLKNMVPGKYNVNVIGSGNQHTASFIKE